MKNQFHVPTNTLRWIKDILSKRELPTPYNIRVWEEHLRTIEDLTQAEQIELKEVILNIKPSETTFDIPTLISLITHTVFQYYNEYVLLKYSPEVTYESSWNQWYLQARGCVINLNKMEIASASLPKFFNLNEKPETHFSIVEQKMKKQPHMYYIKQDGSCVNLSHVEELIITTPGSFISKQTKWAKEFLEKNRTTFLQDLPIKFQDITFVFEYVGPENRVVVNYSKTDMILLHMVHRKTGRILPFEEVEKIANEYGFTMCDVSHITLEQILHEKDDAGKYKAEDMEGWILRIDKEDDTFMVKVKCADYIRLHYVLARLLNPKWVLQAMIEETLDDQIAQIDDENIKVQINKMIHIINLWNQERKEEFRNIYRTIPSEKWCDQSVLQNFLTYETLKQDFTANHEKQDRIIPFLNRFAKGKTEDPKEEFKLLANQIYENHTYDFSLLEGYDAYKNLLGNRIDEWAKELKDVLHAYVFEGVKEEAWLPIIEKEFSVFYDLQKNVPDLETWELTFKENKDKFYKLVATKIENMRKDEIAIATYAKNLYQYEQTKKAFLTKMKKHVLQYFLKEWNEEGFKEKISPFFEDELLIDHDFYQFQLQKKDFEQTYVLSFLDGDEQKRDGVIKEFYRILRGVEVDSSYGIAKDIHKQFPKELQNQQAYFKERGQFSAYVSKELKTLYNDFLFDLYTVPTEQHAEYIERISFLPLANLVVAFEVEIQSVWDVDFRDLQKILNEFAIQDN